jgi:hypothetical protein
MPNLKMLGLIFVQLSHLSPVKKIYQNGSFRERSDYDYDILITYNELNISAGSTNRGIIRFLQDNGVRVDWKEGNFLY